MLPHESCLTVDCLSILQTFDDCVIQAWVFKSVPENAELIESNVFNNFKALDLKWQVQLCIFELLVTVTLKQ